jgi:hypothetical protein
MIFHDPHASISRQYAFHLLATTIVGWSEGARLRTFECS